MSWPNDDKVWLKSVLSKDQKKWNRGPRINQKRAVAFCPWSPPCWRQSAAFQNCHWAGHLGSPLQLAFISSHAKSNISSPVAHLNWKGPWNSAHRGKRERTWKFLRRLQKWMNRDSRGSVSWGQNTNRSPWKVEKQPPGGRIGIVSR